MLDLVAFFSQNNRVLKVLSPRLDKEDFDYTTRSFWDFLMDVFRCFQMFSDGFDVLKLYLHRLPAKAARLGDWHF